MMYKMNAIRIPHGGGRGYWWMLGYGRQPQGAGGVPEQSQHRTEITEEAFAALFAPQETGADV